MGHGTEGHARASADLDARTAKTVAVEGELSEATAMEQSAVSHQLRLLRNLGLVEGERRGRSIVYALYDDHVAELLDQAVFHSEHLHLGSVDRPTESQSG